MSKHRARIRVAKAASGSDSSDTDFWRQHIGDEPLIWAGRPEQGFRISPEGQWVIGGMLVLSVLTLVYFGVFTGRDLMWLIVPFVILCNVALVVIGLLRAWLDRNNRRTRRYAITRTRVVAFRNIHNERIRSLPIGPETKVLIYPEGEPARAEFKIRDDSDDDVVLAFANQGSDGKVTASVQFEQLTKAQVDEILKFMKRQGLLA